MSVGSRRKRGEPLFMRWARVLGWRKAFSVISLITELTMHEELEGEWPTIERFCEIQGMSHATFYRHQKNFLDVTPEFSSIREFVMWSKERSLSVEQAARQFVWGGELA